MNEDQKSGTELQQERDPDITRRDAPPKRKNREVFQIIFLMAAAWGVYRLDQYYKHGNDRWYLVALSATWVIYCSCLLIYSWKKKRANDGFFSWGSGDWVYRNDDPYTYWFYMILFLFWDGVGVYWLYEALTRGSV